MHLNKPYFKPEIKEGRFEGHVVIVLSEHRERDAFSRQGADEIITKAFSKGKITGPDFSRLLEEVINIPYLRDSKEPKVYDCGVNFCQLELSLDSEQKIMAQSQMAVV